MALASHILDSLLEERPDLQIGGRFPGDERFDWLQTTVRLFPARMAWNLASNLSGVQVSIDQAPFFWSGPDAWVDGQGRRLVAISHAPVQVRVQENQVLFHPLRDDQDTTITLFIADNPYTNLTAAFAMADEAVGRSNGVRYTVALSTDDKTYTNLLEKDVSRAIWETVKIDLCAYLHQALTLKLISSSKGNDSYDWLQITLELLSIASPK
jgi:hypothetical protein